jgi:peptidoglycan/xylan/chitin deacetylase (PgdA/CDA1 family)
MSLHNKRRIGKLFGILPRPAHRRVILIYHTVGGGPLSLPVGSFRDQLAWLSEQATVLSLDALLKIPPDQAGLYVTLTFDDGYRSLYSVVTPELEHHGFPATVYLNTNLVADTTRIQSNPQLGHYAGEEFLLWSEVEDMASRGWTIGSHGIDHVDLTGLPDADVFTQVTTSKATIEKRISQSCAHFAYTWGRHSADVRHAVKRASYRNAVASHHAPLSDRDDPLALPRIDIRKEYELQDFIAVVMGRWDFLNIVQRLNRIAG